MQVIRDLLAHDKYVIVVEHDLSVLDYLSDYICCLYGNPGAYGVVTMPFSVRYVCHALVVALCCHKPAKERAATRSLLQECVVIELIGFVLMV